MALKTEVEKIIAKSLYADLEAVIQKRLQFFQFLREF